MPKLAKRFLIGVAIIVVALAFILLCVNLYLQSGDVQQRIRDGAARALGTKVEVGRTTFTPWSGLVLKDISLPELAQAGMAAEAAALQVQCAFLPLLQQRFIVTEATLFEPQFVVRQLENGQWRVPFPAPKARTPKIPKIPEVREVPAPRPVTPGPRIKGPSFTAEIHRFRVVAGQIAFVNAKGKTVLVLEKSAIDAHIAPDLTVEGRATIGQMTIGDALKPRKVGGSFTWDGGTLDMPDIQGSLAGGQLSGRYRLEIGDEPKFAFAAQLHGVLLKKLVAEAGIEPGKTDGQLQGFLDLEGNPGDTDSLSGKGHFELLEARLKPVEVLRKLGELLGIDELQLLQLSDARIDLTIGDKRVRFDDIFLKSENLILRGRGPIRFNGKIDLEAELWINQKLQSQLGGILGRNFVATDDPEYSKLEFSVTGRTSRPRTDLLDKLTGISIGQDIGGLLQGLFRSVPAQDSGGDGDGGDKDAGKN